MTDERLDDLIDQHLNGTLSAARRRELEERLLHSATDRARFWELAEIHVMLQEVLQQRLVQPAIREVTAGGRLESAPAPVKRWKWLPWSPLAAAAAGLALGIFGASAAWAYASPALPVLFKHVLALANAAFEQNVEPLPNGVPIQFGIWSGDYAKLVGPEQGIAPKNGRQMFRFLRSDSVDPASRGSIFHSNIYQVVDIRNLREAIADGPAIADWSVWVNCVASPTGEQTKFVASVWAFAGDTSILPRNWPDKLYQEIAYSSWNITADADPLTWQRIACTMVVPPDATFLVVELKVVPSNPHPVDGAVSFAGHYADEGELSLRTKTRGPVNLLSSPKS